MQQTLAKDDMTSLQDEFQTALSAAFGVDFGLLPFEDAAAEDAFPWQTDGDFAPFTTEVAPGRHRLSLPARDFEGRSRIVFAEFETGEPEQLVRTAHVVLRSLQAERQLDEARRKLEAACLENESLATQLTADFEELAYLRSVTECMELSDGMSDSREVVQKILPLLNRSINAESLVFLQGTIVEGTRYEALRLLGSDGDPAVDVDTLRRVAIDYAQQAADQPLVRNNLCHSSDREACTGVDQLVLVQVARPPRFFGWLMAIRSCFSPSNPDRTEYGTVEASLLATTATVLANYLANQELLREQEKLHVDVVRTLVSTIEAKDEYTRGHSDRVAMYTKRTAEAMGLDARQCQDLYLAGILHDVGKIGVLDTALKGEGKLTEEQFDHVKQHPALGGKILRRLDALNHVLPGIIHHHERFDGNGYPDGLAGEDIPFPGRLIAVADAYDAMTSDRSYRAGMPQAKAEAILRAGAGTQWDPAIVGIFLSIMDELLVLRRKHESRQPKEDGDSP